MKTKFVIELSSVKEVPCDHIECSVCGLFKEPESFRNEGEPRQSRTNCRTCYEAPSETWAEIKKEVAAHGPARQALIEERDRKATLQGFSMPVEELIAALKKLPEGSRVTITQEGYYAQGKFADIHLPEKVEEGFYSIGHSLQSY